MRAVSVLAMLASLLLLALAPSASACHLPPSPTAAGACTGWSNPPFGAVPFALGCVGALNDDRRALCNYVLEETDEILNGCPPNNSVACA